MSYNVHSDSFCILTVDEYHLYCDKIDGELDQENSFLDYDVTEERVSFG